MTLKTFMFGAAVAAVSLFAVGASAQTVGSRDSGNCYPFNCNDSGTSTGQSIDYQEIYSSSAFSGAETINNITFYDWTPYSVTPTVLSGNYDIIFGTTTQPLGSGYPVSLSNVETFYDGSLNPLVGTSYSIAGHGYNYDPLDGNLVMEVIASNQANVPNYTTNGYFWADYTGSDVSRAYLITNVGAASGTGALVTTFNGVPEPATWAMMLLGMGGIGALMRSRRKQAPHVRVALS
jgi:hypothetical protein